MSCTHCTGDPLTIDFLINNGANPNVKGQYGRTPLYRAAFSGRTEAVKVNSSSAGGAAIS